MTRGASLALLLGALLLGRCVCIFPPVGIGDPCQESKTCSSDLVCVLLDEDDPDSATVCMPPLGFDTTDCGNDTDCMKEGMPTESFCTPEGHCACDDLMDNAHLGCVAPEVPGRFSCSCVASDQLDVGDSCSYPEECTSSTCKGGECAATCDAHDDCGFPTTTCNAESVCE